MKNIHCVSPLTPSDCQELAKVVEKSGAKKLDIYLDKNSPDTVKRLCELCPGVSVDVRLSERGGGWYWDITFSPHTGNISMDEWMSERRGGWCWDITFSPHTDNINMDLVGLYPGQVTRLHQLVSLAQSWTVRYSLYLNFFGAEDWTELSRAVDTLDSVRTVGIERWSAPPSVSLLETLWNKTQQLWNIDNEKYYKTNEEDFSKLVMKHFQ